MRYRCDDGYGEAVEYDGVESARAAAERYVDDGAYAADGEDDTPRATTWVTVHCVPIDDDGEILEDEDDPWIKIQVDPIPPKCLRLTASDQRTGDDGRDEHDWADYQGPVGHGGGVIYTEVCRHCGVYRETDSWAQDPSDGEQGLDSVEYRPADEESLAWIGWGEAGDEDEADTN